MYNMDLSWYNRSMKNVIFIGMNPGKLNKPRRWEAPTMRRFSTWLDHLNLNIVSFTNVSPDPDWDLKVASVDTNFFRQTIAGYDKYVAWGGLVSKYLSWYKIDHFMLPHPSGLNRQINNHDYIISKLDECKEYLCRQ